MRNVRDRHNIHFVIESLYVEIYRASKGFPVGAVQDASNILTHCYRSYSAFSPANQPYFSAYAHARKVSHAHAHTRKNTAGSQD